MAAMFVLPLIVYLLTCAPDVTEGDSAELAGAAWYLGVSHMGYPLHALMGKALALLPFGTVGYRILLLSALSISGTMCILGAALRHTNMLPDVMLPAFISLAFLPFLWHEALGIEVYAVHLMMTVLFLWILFAGTGSGKRLQLKHILSASFIFGLGFGIHLATILWCGPVIVSMLFSLHVWKHVKDLQPRPNIAPWSGPGLCAIVMGASIMLLVPLRASRGLPWNWNVADTCTGLVHLLTGQSFRHAVMFSHGQPNQWTRFLDYFQSFFNDIPIILLIMGTVGAVLLLRGPRRDIVYSCLTFALMEFYYCMYLNQAPLEVTPFGLVTKLMIVVSAFQAIKRLGDMVGKHGRKFLLFFALVVLATIGNKSHDNFNTLNQAEETIALRFTSDVAASMVPSVILVCEKDEIFSLLYAQTVEHAFSDIIIIHYLQLKQPSPWIIRLLDDLYAPHPIYQSLRVFLSTGFPVSEVIEDPILEALYRFSRFSRRPVATTFPDLLLKTPPGTAYQRGLTIITGMENTEKDNCQSWHHLRLPESQGISGPLRRKYCTMLSLAGNRAFATGESDCYQWLVERRDKVCRPNNLAVN